MSNELTSVYNYYGNNKKYESQRNNSCNYANNLPKMKKKITSVAELKKKNMKVYPSTSESLKIVLQINRYVFKLLEKNVLNPPLYTSSCICDYL